jgi:hypothetical protein
MASSVRRAIGRREAWTPEAVRRATAALATITAAPASTVGAEDKELASRLVRCLRYIAEVEPEELVDTFDRCRPVCESPQWDELYAWLLRDQTNAELLVRLRERDADPASVTGSRFMPGLSVHRRKGCLVGDRVGVGGAGALETCTIPR